MSCNTTKYLGEGEKFLRDSEMTFIKSEKQSNLNLLEYEIEALLEQTPNSRYLFVPSRYYYYRNQEASDTLWYNRWIKKNVAEVPAIYSQELTELTTQNIQKYLINKKGYYDARVSYETIESDQFVSVEYKIDLGLAYRTQSMIYIGNDDEVIRILAATKDKTVVKPEEPLDALTFDVERQRIIDVLQNNGYADFNSNYIKIKGDSTVNERRVEVFFEIETPQGSSKHKKYTIGEINVYTDFDQSDINTPDSLFVMELDGKYFHRSNSEFVVKPNTINRGIAFKSGNLYSRESYNQTIQSLGNLSAYKFVRISPKVNSENGSVIDYDIYLTAYRHKWIVDVGNDIFYSTVNAVSRRQLGLSLGGSLSNRNFLGGGETYRLNAETGFEFELNLDSLRNNSFTNTFNIGLQNELRFPRLVDVTKTFSTMQKLNIISLNRYQRIKRKAQTSVSFGAGFQRIIRFYDVTSITAAYGFDIQSSNRRTIFKQFGVGLFLYDIKKDFQVVIQDNILIQKSLSNNLFTGFLFSELNLVWTKPPDKLGVSRRINMSFETSGLEVFLANSLFADDPWLIPGAAGQDDIDFANFVKYSFDYRWYRELNPRNQIAFRAFVGFALPYYNDEAVPFIKQFYVGGPNGIRAWQPRELGPGAYIETSTITDRLFYQTGDFKLEWNLEYRTDLFYIFEGALFIDAGNVWTLTDDVQRPGSKFGADFFTQIAVGAGYGIRIDFNYFNLRFDFGYKLLNPYEDDNGSRLVDLKSQSLLGNVNVAINYPF